MIRRLRLAVAVFAWALIPAVLSAAEPVHVVHGQQAPTLERFAAQELAGQFKRLFDVDVTVSSASKSGVVNVYVGSPRTNGAIRKQALTWPELTDQGIHLQRVPSGLVVGGGSPVATLWAVYELGHRFGIRYLSRGDIFPDRQPLKLDGMAVTLEPNLRLRTWRTVNDFAIGPESWGLEQHKVVLRQLAKMKFNRVMLSFWPWQPFVHYESGGVKKSTATLWFGDKLRVDGDTPGKTVFNGAKLFENPDLAGANSYEALTTAGTKLARGIIEEAQRLGMSVGLSIQPAEFTREFAAALPGSKSVHQLKRLTIGPGKQGPADVRLRKLVVAKIRGYLETYPTIDALYIGMPEFPEWDEHVDSAFQQLNRGGRLGDLTVAKLTDQARKRKIIASGDRGAKALRGNLVPLAFFQDLFSDPNLLARPAGGHVQLVIRSLDPALFPVLDRVLPPGASTLNFVDYTARRVAENPELLAPLPAQKVKSSLIFTLADDNVGVLSQSSISHLHKLVTLLRKHGWEGFSTRYWMLTELDPTLHYLSRAAFDTTVTPRSSHDELFGKITGKPAPSDRLWKAFQHIEAATDLIDQKAIGFGFPVAGMMMKHYRAQAEPSWWKDVNEHYTQAMIEIYRSHDAAHSRSRRLLFYYAKRSEYVLEYLNAVKAVREAAVAKKKGDGDAAFEKMENAVEQLYNAIDTLSDVVRDQSDRGLIAVLANHAYRPLLAEYEKMADEEE